MHRPAWTETILATLMALAVSTAPAVAGGDKAQPTAGGDDKGRPGSSTHDQSQPSAMPRDGGDFTGRHTMSGEVTKVDQSKGMMTLETQEGTLDLHFPPSALQNVKVGDRVRVELALKADAAGAGRSPTDGSASPRTEPGATQKGTGGTPTQ